MSVRKFFDQSSEFYDAKYSSSASPYLHHFFVERLKAATAGLDPAGKIIWDIGAGTGQLYRHLSDAAPDFDYHAVDISEHMLLKSPIPADRRHVGTFPDVANLIADHSVDYFFMLGVTTYMSDEAITATFALMREKAATGARAMVTLTNRHSVEWLLQRAVSRALAVPAIGRAVGSEKRVAGQRFARNFMTLGHFRGLLPEGVNINAVCALNQTFTPLNRWAPGPSLAVERAIRVLTQKDSSLRRFLSSDFLVRLSFQ